MTKLELYNYHYSNAHKIAKRLILKVFLKNKSETRPFNYFFMPIVDWIKEYSDNSEVFKNQELFPKAYKLFEFRKRKYVGSEDEIVEKILENEIFECFDLTYSDDYRKFIIEVAIQKVLESICTHLSNYLSYYSLVYKTNKYKFFYLKNFENGYYEDTKEYVEMMNFNQPDRQNLKLLPVEQNELINSISASFTNDERMLVAFAFNTLLKKKKVFSLTSILRLTNIIGGFNDDAIFIEDPSSLTLYKKASLGFIYYDSYEGQISLFESSIDKLKTLKLDIIVNWLKSQLVSTKIKNK